MSPAFGIQQPRRNATHGDPLDGPLEYDRCDEIMTDPSSDRRRLIASAYDPQLLEQAGRRMAEVLAEHFRSVEKGEGAVLNWVEPAENVLRAKGPDARGRLRRIGMQRGRGARPAMSTRWLPGSSG